nr:hypothetical protein [Tanacetum cinerariifolium]
MTTLAEHMIVAEAKNRPLMLEKSMCDLWPSRIHLFIKGKKNGRIMLDSIDNGPLVCPTDEEDGQTRPKKYSELNDEQKLQDDCDVQATNIILLGLPSDVYALVNHEEAAKNIWDRVKLLMKGTKLSYREYLNAQLQEKVFAIATLENELRKLKVKNIVDIIVSPRMFKIDLEPLPSKLLKIGKHTRTTLRVKPTTSARESKPAGNTKKNRITRPLSINQKNKVKEHHRKVKFSLHKMNSIYEPIINAHIKHSVRNAKFEFVCASCNKYLFDANHDMCFIDYVNDVNVCAKSKSKRNKIRKVWKPTGKVFTEIGYSWKPTGRIFIIDGNRLFKLLCGIWTLPEIALNSSTSSGSELQLMTHATSSSGPVPKPILQQPCNPPTRDDWDRLFQPMFDEYFNPPSGVVSPVQDAATQRAIDLADSHVSTSINQDAPLTILGQIKEGQEKSVSLEKKPRSKKNEALKSLLGVQTQKPHFDPF